MAFDHDLADRARELLEPWSGLSERKMFGGVGFMLNGNMAVGVIGDDLVVRLDPDDADRALKERGVREFDFTGRKMRGWIFVAPEASAADQDLAEWVQAGAAYAGSLPPK
jgi:TfoX/Sxy family transcriptional regulator of competence genes